MLPNDNAETLGCCVTGGCVLFVGAVVVLATSATVGVTTGTSSGVLVTSGAVTVTGTSVVGVTAGISSGLALTSVIEYPAFLK